jgi:2-phospho-L-lactate guanylyltransferase
MSHDTPAIAIVPVKHLAAVKSRLAAVLTAPQRRALALAMLDDVLAALTATRGLAGSIVVGSDEAVAQLAHTHGARYLGDTAGELNAALALASQAAADAGAAAVLVVPADLPTVVPAEIEALLAARSRRPHIVLASADDGGTGALLLAPPQAMPFAFGPGSAARHRSAARAAGLEVLELRASGLARDIDRPGDLRQLIDTPRPTATQRLLAGFAGVLRTLHDPLAQAGT